LTRWLASSRPLDSRRPPAGSRCGSCPPQAMGTRR
jgi:hypothetical protein